MSDTGRQSMTDKAAAAMKPDSQKGIMEQTGDMMSGAMDSAAAALQPNSQKSGSQRVSDSMSGKGGDNKDTMLNKAKNVVGMGSSTGSNTGSNTSNT